MKPRVLIGPAPMREIPHTYAPLLEGAFELVYPKRVAQLTEAELLEQFPGCVASLAGSEPYTRKVIEAALARYPTIVAIVVTGYGTVKDAVDMIKLGAADFISKPFQFDELSAGQLHRTRHHSASFIYALRLCQRCVDGQGLL